MKELLENPLVLQILFGIVLLVLPSPLLKKTGNKVGDAIEGVGGEKARSTAYKLLFDFAKGLKKSKHNGDINLTSNDQIDSELDKYKVSLGFGGLKIKRKGLEFKIDPWNHKTKLFKFKIFRRANSIRKLFKEY